MLALLLVFVSTSIFAQSLRSVEGDVYLKPTKVTYHNAEMSGNNNDIRFYVKVDGSSELGCFGYNGSMGKNQTASNFKNLNIDGAMLIGKRKGDQTLSVRFDGWVNTTGDAWAYESGDLEKSDASVSVSLSGTNVVRAKAKGQYCDIEFEVYQKMGNTNNRRLMFQN